MHKHFQLRPLALTMTKMLRPHLQSSQLKPTLQLDTTLQHSPWVSKFPIVHRCPCLTERHNHVSKLFTLYLTLILVIVVDANISRIHVSILVLLIATPHHVNHYYYLYPYRSPWYLNVSETSGQANLNQAHSVASFCNKDTHSLTLWTYTNWTYNLKEGDKNYDG